VVTPSPPIPFPTFNTRRVLTGTRLVRVHDRAFDGAACNPCVGDPTRFAPLATVAGECLPTLYAAASFECAVHGSIFHDIPYDGSDKFVRLGKVTLRAISWIEVTTDLVVAGLHEPDLNRLNLTRAELIDTPRSAYLSTARWAEAFHRADPNISGLVWTSRRCDPETAYVFFEDRLRPGALVVKERVEVASSAHHLGQIRDFAQRTGIIITI
jgi:hypothetical protein